MNLTKVIVDSFKDQRATRYFDLFPEMPGQITVSVIMPRQFSGWHKHMHQTDEFFVAEGTIKIGIITPDGEPIEELLSAEHPQTIKIPPGYWHAWKSLEGKAFLVYHLSKKHNEADEIRGTVEEILECYGYQL
jgi:dTDP-4-dehydrorhamnose 3,5-epimerase-like enzyme